MSKFVKWSPIFNPDGLRPKVTDEYLGSKKMKRTTEAIGRAGDYWLRPFLKKMDLSAFFN